MLYLYALARGLDSAPAAVGLARTPTELVRLGSFDAVVTRHGDLEPDAEAETLVAHAAVVETLMEETEQLVPVRFGSVFENEASLHTAAAARLGEIEDVLREVRGRVEFGLHVVRRAPARRGGERPQTGRDRLLAKLEQLRSAESAAELDRPLVELAVESRRRLLRTPKLLLSAAYLVERARAAEFAERSQAIVDTRPRSLEVLATGPWPPYSFAELERGLDAA